MAVLLMGGHPCEFSRPVLDVVRALMTPSPISHVHDPFAGAGSRLGELCDELGVTFSGTDIEPVFIRDPRVRSGDACDISTYPDRPYWVVTSPVYPNGMADDWAAADGSERKTYRVEKAKALGVSPADPAAQLDVMNMGRYGYRGTRRGGRSRKRQHYWMIAQAAVDCWWVDPKCQTVLVNVSDFTHSKGVVEPVVDDWADLLTKACDGRRPARIPVRTSRYRNGSNREARVETEVILVAVMHP